MAHSKQRRVFDFLLPFLIFISLGVIVVLSIQLWQALEPQKLESEAYLYIANGQTQVLPWGLEQWEPGANGSRILQGDSIKTSSKGRAILKLYDGTTLRVGPLSEVVINSLDQDDQNYTAEIRLKTGSMWVKTGKRRTGSSQIAIRTEHLKATTKGTTFNIETQPNESINLMKGNLEVEVIVQAESREKIVEKIQLNAGKAINLSPSTIRQYESLESPQIISSISNSFTDSEWYQWNSSEDENPTDYSQKIDTSITLPSESSATPEATDSDQTNNEPEEDTTTEEDTFDEVPIVTSPSSSPHTTDKDTVKISGSAPQDTEKIIIVTQENGKDDAYTLRSYEAGDSSWSYTASTQYGNLESGKNEYLIYAENKDGVRSKPAKLVIIYNPSTEDEATPDS